MNIFIFLALMPCIFAENITRREDYAYQVSIRKDGQHICGGSVYSSKFILTAASCVNNTKSLRSFGVVTGNLNSTAKKILPSQFRNISKIYIYDGFRSVPEFNVAILRLDFPLKYDKFTKNIPIARNWTKTVNNCVLSGWNANGTVSNKTILMHANVTEFGSNLSTCSNYRGLFVGNVTMCAGFDGFQDPCVVDLGGPLVCNNMLYGLGSWRDNYCYTRLKPGMYTNITYFANWITETTKTNGGNTVVLQSVPYIVMIIAIAWINL